jgi:hypothetical protein
MKRILLTICLCILGAGVMAPAASAAFGLSEFDVTFTGPEGEPVTQAGSHPYQMLTSLHFNSTPTEEGGELLDEAAKDLLVSQIEGFVGNPTAVPRCSTADFLNGVEVAVPGEGGVLVANCPPASAVGVASVELANKLDSGSFYGAIYNLEPPPGSPARLGFWVTGVPVTLELGVKEAFPYNIVGGPTNISQVLEVVGSTFTLWGNPADPSHDPQRGICLNPNKGTSLDECPANVSEVPFLTLPRACKGPLETTYEADSWQNEGVFVKGSVLTHDSAGNPLGMTGCGKLGFGPEVRVTPTTTAAESASGLDIEIEVEDEGLMNPEGLAQADIEATEFAFPAGMTLNPSAAEGLGVCSLDQFQAEGLDNQACPDASKLGRLEAQTPILENETLEGSVYLAAQNDPERPGAENPFDSLLAAYLVIRDAELGVFVKLPSRIETDESTGQVVASVEDMPPFPLSRVKVQLRSGPRAPFVTPPSCGTYETEAVLVPSSGATPQLSEPSFTVSSGPNGAPCPPGGTPPFSPGFEAGSQNGAAGAFSPFSMRLTRSDGEQDITRFSATLPPGVTAKIAGVGRCPDAQIAAAKGRTGRAELAAPSCPASSKVGRVVAGAGVGTALTYVPGSLYLAGPYNGAPLSVVAVVPAVAGPFDVGTVVTRVALRLNPVTYRAEVDGAASDPIPHILEGIPLKLRDLRVYTDRPSFTLNPTSCQPAATAAQIFGSAADVFSPGDDVAVSRDSRYQASSCASLPFAPKLRLELRGGTKRGGHPALRSTLTPRPGDANIGQAIVTLPPSEFIDNAHINNPCTRVQFAANDCPPGSVLGAARATTPLLDEVLEGPVYFRSNGGERLLPDIVAHLKGTFSVILVGEVTSRKGRLRTTFRTAPDAPVSGFQLNLFGGKRGLLVNNRNLCAKKQRFSSALIGQNGRRFETTPILKTSCKAKKKAKGKKARRR